MLPAMLVGATTAMPAARGPVEAPVRGETGAPRITLSPVRFEEATTDPATSLDYEVVLTNETARAVRVSPAAYPLSGSRDPARYAEVGVADGGASDATGWVSFPGFGRTRTIGAGHQLTVPVHVAVPTGASPGTHTVGVAFSQQVGGGRPAAGDAARVDLGAGLVSVIPFRVSGEADARLRVADVSMPRVLWGGSVPTARVRLENVGNVQLSVDAELRLAAFGELAGRTVADDGPPGGQPMLPGGRRTLAMRWTDPPLVGRFTPTLVVVGGEGSGVRIERELDAVWIVPPWWVLALLVPALAFPAWRLRRRRAARQRRRSR